MKLFKLWWERSRDIPLPCHKVCFSIVGDVNCVKIKAGMRFLCSWDHTFWDAGFGKGKKWPLCTDKILNGGTARLNVIQQDHCKGLVQGSSQPAQCKIMGYGSLFPACSTAINRTKYWENVLESLNASENSKPRYCRKPEFYETLQSEL